MASKKTIKRVAKKDPKTFDPSYSIHFYIYVPIMMGLGVLILTFIYIALISLG